MDHNRALPQGPRSPAARHAWRRPLPGLLLALALTACATPELPAQWPAALPLYPGAVLTAATAGQADSASLERLRISFRSVDEPRKVLEFYTAAAQAAGYSLEAQTGPGAEDEALTAVFVNGKRRLEVHAAVDLRRTGRGHPGSLRITAAQLTLVQPVDGAPSGG